MTLIINTKWCLHCYGFRPTFWQMAHHDLAVWLIYIAVLFLTCSLDMVLLQGDSKGSSIKQFNRKERKMAVNVNGNKRHLFEMKTYIRSWLGVLSVSLCFFNFIVDHSLLLRSFEFFDINCWSVGYFFQHSLYHTHPTTQCSSSNSTCHWSMIVLCVCSNFHSFHLVCYVTLRFDWMMMLIKCVSFHINYS